MIYPWQQAQWQHLQQRIHEKRLAHAFLFCGPEGIGKNDFSNAFSRSLLCLQPNSEGHACGKCNSCTWSDSGAHPDTLHIGLENDAKFITVDQIRSIGHFLSLKSQEGRYKVIVITPAEQMNVNAANSLLKNLEEPTSDTVVILVTSRATALPATIRSRCQKVEFPYPDHTLSTQWLRQQLEQPDQAQTLLSIAKGAPLRALAMTQGGVFEKRSAFFQDIFSLARGQENPVSIGEKWIKQDIQQILSWFHSALADMIKLNMVDAPNAICHSDYYDTLQKCARRLNLKVLYQCYGRVEQAQGLLKANMNPQLIVESILIPWTEMNKA